MKRSGIADLPLHRGRVPAWLAARMTQLGSSIVEHIVLEYGSGEVLTRLSDPFWFQALGCVMGMDWHSSGVTTSVMGALKRGLNPRFSDIGLYVCGGRGRHSKRTPEELRALADKTGLPGDKLVHASRLTARVDNNAMADGFQLYLHSFVIARSGEWAVVQQGMNADSRLARRYHWHSATIREFTCEPHTAVVGEHQGIIVNLVDARASAAQQAMLSVARQPLERSLSEVRRLRMPSHHDLRAEDVDPGRLGAVLAVAHEQELRDFASLLLVEGLGPRTLLTLAMIAEIIHGTPTRFSDPARFSFALGGKDGHPFPVPLKTYDETLGILRRSLAAARIGNREKIDGFRRLDKLTRAAEENGKPMANFEATVAHEHGISESIGGRTVFDKGQTKREVPQPAQMTLFGGRAK